MFITYLSSMIRILFFLLFCCGTLQGKDQVVLIHGFMRSPWSMYFLSKWLKRAGYEVHNWGYPSRSQCIETHGANLARFLQQIDQNEPLYFVTHSMGALVLQAALHHPLTPLSAKEGKAILLAPPHQGSSFARRVEKFSIVRYAAGQKSGHELLSLHPGEWEQKFPLPEEFTVLVLSGIKDQKVQISEGCLYSPHLHDVIGGGHTFIMNRKEVKRAISYFFNPEKKQ